MHNPLLPTVATALFLAAVAACEPRGEAGPTTDDRTTAEADTAEVAFAPCPAELCLQCPQEIRPGQASALHTRAHLLEIPADSAAPGTPVFNPLPGDIVGVHARVQLQGMATLRLSFEGCPGTAGGIVRMRQGANQWERMPDDSVTVSGSSVEARIRETSRYAVAVE